MSYVDNTISKIEDGLFDIGSNGTSGVIPPVWDMTIDLQSSLSDKPNIKDNLFVYYERRRDDQSILAFRLPEEDSSLIFVCRAKEKKGEQRCYVKLASMKGKSAYTILRAVVRSVIPFFRDVEDYFKGKEKVDSCSCTMSVSKMSSRIKKIDYLPKNIGSKHKTIKPKKKF